MTNREMTGLIVAERLIEGEITVKDGTEVPGLATLRKLIAER